MRSRCHESRSFFRSWSRRAVGRTKRCRHVLTPDNPESKAHACGKFHQTLASQFMKNAIDFLNRHATEIFTGVTSSNNIHGFVIYKSPSVGVSPGAIALFRR